MSDRGVLYVVWGDKIQKVLDRSIDSVKRVHPELPVHIQRLPEDPAPFRGLLEKANMLEMTPFRNTLFLDADTVVLGRLDYGFEKAQRFGLACAICECPWARRYGGIHGDIIEYNTGVLFFTDKARPVFETWKKLSTQIDSSILIPRENDSWMMPFNDQASFAQAIENSGFQPHVLPLNWNFRPEWHASFFGPIKIWHHYQDVPPALLEINRQYERPDAVIEYHREK